MYHIFTLSYNLVIKQGFSKAYFLCMYRWGKFALGNVDLYIQMDFNHPIDIIE